MDPTAQLNTVEYRILKHLGGGSSGYVYLIHHSSWGEIALKQLSASADQEKHLKKWKKEVAIHQNLRHPNVVTFFHAHIDSQICRIFIEYVKHGPVDEFLNQFKVTWEWKCQIIYDVALAMGFLHNQKPAIIHGDLKCPNILIGVDYRAKVSDFGLAQYLNFSDSVEFRSGTLEYIAPEYFKTPCPKKTEKFDVYSYAISVWEIFSQKHAYYDFTVRQTIGVAVEKGERPLMRDIKDIIPRSIISLMQNCWKPRNEERPSFSVVIKVLFEELSLIEDKLKSSDNVVVEPEFERLSNLGYLHEPGGIPAELQDDEIQKCIRGLEKVRSSIVDYLDPENGLLLCLQCSGVLEGKEYNKLDKSRSDERKSYVDINNDLLNVISPRFDSCCIRFLKALDDNGQHHVVNYIMNGGIDMDTDDRVLTSDEIDIIDDNMFCLVNLINPHRMNFLYRLVKKKCITNRHKEKVEKWSETEKKIDELLRIIKRRSFKDFKNFKLCLHDTMQNKIVDILEKGGIVNRSCEVQPEGRQENY